MPLNGPSGTPNTKLQLCRHKDDRGSSRIKFFYNRSVLSFPSLNRQSWSGSTSSLSSWRLSPGAPLSPKPHRRWRKDSSPSETPGRAFGRRGLPTRPSVSASLAHGARGVLNTNIAIVVFPGDGRGGATPSTRERRDIGLGGGRSSELKARLAALQLEYEALSQRYGSRPPSHVAQRLEAIAAELDKYGIAIVKSPDGTTTVITPGKTRRDLVIGEGGHANPSVDLVGLETTLEQLMLQYGPNPPRKPSQDYATSLGHFGTREIRIGYFLSINRPTLDGILSLPIPS